MRSTRTFRLSPDGRHVPIGRGLYFRDADNYRGNPGEGAVIVTSGCDRELAGYRLVGDKRLLKRKSSDLPLVKPDPYWT